MSDSRSRILADIAQALARHPVEAGTSSADATAYPHPELDPAGSETALRRFAESLAKVGGECHIMNDEEAALSKLRGIMGECHGQSVLVPPDGELDRMGVARIALETGCFVQDPQISPLEVASMAAVGITVAFGGISDTGTIVLVHATSADQLSALLPPNHIVLLKRLSIYPDKLSLIAELHTSGFDFGAAIMTWVTGPSLTADIEKVLVRGAHGPRRVVALVY
jgi:L-lactate dehydrogenase complex protein LldG